MGVFHGEYPDDLGKVLRHARRFVDVLARMEQKGVPGDWVVGRAGEVRAIVSYFLEDWRNGVSEKDKTLEAISTYLDSKHREASGPRGCVAVVDQCCGSDEAITLVPLGADAQRPVSLDAEDSGGSFHSIAPTQKVPWKDTPEMLELFHGNLRIIDEVAAAMMRRIGTRVATLDELKGFGREGLLDAARRFSPSQGPFGAWARQRIRGAILDGLGQWGLLSPRVWRRLEGMETERSEACGPGGEDSGGEAAALEDMQAGGEPGSDTRLAELLMAIAGRGIGIAAVDAKGRSLSGADGGSPEELAMRSELNSVLLEVVATLPSQQKEVVERYYFRDETLEEAAAAMGIGTPRASRVRASAMERIERGLRARGVDGWSFLRLVARRN